MPWDFEVERGTTFGEWLRRAIADEVIIEEAGWAPERAARTAERLQAGRPPEERLVPLVPWMEEATAFTGPGRYVYLTRPLIERFADDEPAAFVVAHEIAHHDLHHVQLSSTWLPLLARAHGGGILVWAVIHALQKRLGGPVQEAAADRRALELCLRAGYDGARCLFAFDVLEMLALDAGDLDAVYGPADYDEEIGPHAWWGHRLMVWTWEHTGGYYCLRDRKAALLALLEPGGELDAMLYQAPARTPPGTSR